MAPHGRCLILNRFNLNRYGLRFGGRVGLDLLRAQVLVEGEVFGGGGRAGHDDLGGEQDGRQEEHEGEEGHDHGRHHVGAVELANLLHERLEVVLVGADLVAHGRERHGERRREREQHEERVEHDQRWDARQAAALDVERQHAQPHAQDDENARDQQEVDLPRRAVQLLAERARADAAGARGDRDDGAENDRGAAEHERQLLGNVHGGIFVLAISGRFRTRRLHAGLSRNMATLVAPHATPGQEDLAKNQGEQDAANDAVEASSDDTDSSSDDDSDEDDSDEDSEDEDEERPGFVARVKNAVQAKQQRLLEARRDPVLEWKEKNRWTEENAATIAKAERVKALREEKKQAKAAVRERKQKRKAQRRLTKQKEVEFRMQLQEYDDALVKSDKRRDLLTKFTIETHAEQKKRQMEQGIKSQLKAERVAAQRIRDAIEHDIVTKQEEISHVQQVIDASDVMGRKCGILPAINTPVPIEVDEQDETSSLVILRVNKATTEDDALSSLQRIDSVSPSRESQTSTASDARRGSPMMQQSRSSSTAKRLFFTVNLKRFKHADQIRGEGIGDHGGKELARSLLTGACPRVKRIYLGWNHVKYPGIAALSDSFIRGACGQLQVLDLRCNCVDAKAFDQLIRVFEKDGLPELVELILQGNTLGDEGAKALAHALLKGTLKTLQVIDIRQNRIRNAGALAIWNVFSAQTAHRYCPKLQLLDLRRNEAQGALTRSFCPCPSFLEF